MIDLPLDVLPNEIERLNREIDRLRSILPRGLAAFPERPFDDLPNDVGSLTIYRGGRQTFDQPITIRGIYCHTPCTQGDIDIYQGVYEQGLPELAVDHVFKIPKGSTRADVNSSYYLRALRKLGRPSFTEVPFPKGFTMIADGHNAQVTIFYSML